jgi:energy-coupling factor transporter ATP-binding protein EcfA2
MEKIIIKNFGPIEDAEIEIRKVLVLIGEQASGKSTIAKLIFYFKTIADGVWDRLNASSTIDPSQMSALLLSAYRSYFSRLFTAVAAQSDFKIEYTYPSGLTVRLTPSGYNGPIVTFGDAALASKLFETGKIRITGEELKSSLDGYTQESSSEGNADLERSLALRKAIRDCMESLRREFHAVLGGHFVNRIFTPAGRESYEENRPSQFSNTNPGPFEYTNIPTSSSDHLLTQRFDDYRKGLNDFFKTPLITFEERFQYVPHSDAPHLINRIRKILKGTFGTDGVGNPYILLDKVDKRVYLSDASSGQKSAYPILQDSFASWFIVLDHDFADVTDEKNHAVFRVIEEPEAHLFPTAQKQLIELLVFLANAQKESQIIITTHSPYVLTSVNNMLMAYHAAASSPASEAEISELYPPKFRIAPDDLASYSLGNTAFEPEEGDEPEPFCVDILARDTGMIAQNYLDTVSEWLGYEFHFLMGIYRKANPRRAAQ